MNSWVFISQGPELGRVFLPNRIVEHLRITMWKQILLFPLLSQSWIGRTPSINQASSIYSAQQAGRAKKTPTVLRWYKGQNYICVQLGLFVLSRWPGKHFFSSMFHWLPSQRGLRNHSLLGELSFLGNGQRTPHSPFFFSRSLLSGL